MFVVYTWVLVQGAATYRTFFREWVDTPEYYKWYHAEWAEAAHVLNEYNLNSSTIVFLPYPLHNEHFGDAHYGFDYLYQGEAPAKVVAATTPHNLAQKIEDALASRKPVKTVKLVDWDNETVGGDDRAEKHAASILNKYGLHLESKEYGKFQIHTYIDVSMAGPWTPYERLEPRIIHFDGGISLYGFNHGRGVEPPSSHQELTMEETHPLWVALLWQTAPGLEVEYSISLRLHNAAGDRVHLQDFVLLNRFTNSTRDWTPEEPVDTFHYLDLPSDLPPGQYELRLVVYDFESLKPTVELGVWEPETTISRLQIGEPN